ncbi:MAG: glycosyltransferase [Desulfobacteraceae bacterium]|nr:glycosyltransferase [Desulfobacteraceae bacterium]
MGISVIVPAYNAEADLPNLLDSLLRQNCNDFEVIVVDDCSEDGTAEVVKHYDYSLIQLSENHGPAYCRNIGAKNARGDILAFTDSDCRVEFNWIDTIQKCFLKDDFAALMGRVALMPSSFLGNAISAVGFPAGGSIGFDKVWKVDENGFTDSLSTCNCAVRADVFHGMGGFDTSFPFPGGEDSLFAYDLRKLNYRVKYCPDVLVYHGARNALRDFVRWQFRRGVSSFIFSTKVSNKANFLSLRIWSTGNVLRACFREKRFPLVLCLLCISLCMQFIGFLSARFNKESYADSNH